MNVLHEIEITQWLKTFKNIESVLDDNGILIFIEVLSLTKGEQPYGNNGYLVLQDEQVKKLFAAPKIRNCRVGSKEKSNCWVLTKALARNVTQGTITNSLHSLSDSSYMALRTEYQKKIDYAHGTADDQQKLIAARNYDFLSQQYINAELALEVLAKREEKSLIIPEFLKTK